jgi:hypothetical protein
MKRNLFILLIVVIPLIVLGKMTAGSMPELRRNLRMRAMRGRPRTKDE